MSAGFRASGVVVVGAVLASLALGVGEARADDADTVLQACRTHDGGLSEPTCQCLARGLGPQDMAVFAQLMRARETSESEAMAIERKNGPILRKIDDTMRRCQGG